MNSQATASSSSFGLVVVAMIALAGAATAGMALYSSTRMQSEIARLDQQLTSTRSDLETAREELAQARAKLASGGGEAGDSGVGTDALESLSSRVDQLDTRAANLAERLDEVAASGTNGDAGPFGGGTFTPEQARTLERLNREMADVQERVKELDGVRPAEDKGPFGEENKPSLQDVQSALEMDEDQTKALHEVLRAQKAEMLEILTVPDENGVSTIDKFLKIMFDQKIPNEQKQAAAIEIFTSRPPGSSENLSEIDARVNQNIMETMAQVLTDDQYERFVRMNVKATDIKFGDDPVDQYAAQRLPQILQELERENE